MNAVFWFSAWLLASLPWCNAKRFGVFGAWTAVQARSNSKPFWLVCVESVTLYSLALVTMFALEAQQGQRATQQWQFWAIAACLWVVLAFPAAAWFKLRRS